MEARRCQSCLLAESHVRTSPEDFVHDWSYSKNPVYQGDFVRFVYCLANCERHLVDIPSNKGTWQFWKILFSCVYRISENRDFAPILREFTPDFDERMSKKIQLLQKLKQGGVWLVDASIIGINSLQMNLRAKVLRTCWESYTGPLLEDLDPRSKHILVIGDGVEKTLHNRLSRLGVAGSMIPKPQARLKGGYGRYYQKCFEICSNS